MTDREPEPPDQPAIVVGPDGVPLAQSEWQPDGDPGPWGSPTARRIGIVVLTVAVFALGVVLGRHSVTGAGRTPAPIAGTTGTSSTAPTASGHATTSPTPPVTNSAGTDDRHATSHSSEASPTPQPSVLTQAVGPCGTPRYVAQVAYVSPHPQPIAMTILAGSPPRLYDLRDGTVSDPIMALPDHDHYVDAVAAGDNGTVVAVRSCTDPMSVAIERVSRDGSVTPIEIPSGWRSFGQLTARNGQVLAPIWRDGSSVGSRLLTTDGSGATVPRPTDDDETTPPSIVSPDGRWFVTAPLNDDGTPGYHLQLTDALSSGAARTVPGIRLGNAKAAISFSPDSTWLVVGVPTLAGGRVLLYRTADLQGPYAIPGTVPGQDVPIYVSGP